MKTEKQKIGRKGERAAARLLRRSGYRVVAKNCYFGKNELDIVARDKQYIVFVEVKARTADTLLDFTARPSEAVDPEKRRRTVAAAICYLKQHPTPLCPRFDVVEVYFDRERRHRLLKINHIANAFTASGKTR
ncbi:MAG: YraN family protein [Ruminococcaceae bacterium]|nr:YraN family protein [Oscillospiraceae bacterium]